jgi:hypothetical protein
MRTRLWITGKTDVPDAELQALVDRLRKMVEAELSDVVLAFTDGTDPQISAGQLYAPAAILTRQDQPKT